VSTTKRLPSTSSIARPVCEVKQAKASPPTAASRAATRKMSHQSSHPCLLSSNVSKERNNMTTDIFAPPPSFPSADSSSLHAPPPTADEPGRNQQSKPSEDRGINRPQGALKPDTTIPTNGFGYIIDNDGKWWCKCWCGREFRANESIIRGGLPHGCGGPKHYLKTTKCERSRRSRMKGLRRPS
jgi:hypothetical protein